MPGAALATAGVMATVFYVSQSPDWGWAGARTLPAGLIVGQQFAQVLDEQRIGRLGLLGLVDQRLEVANQRIGLTRILRALPGLVAGRGVGGTGRLHPVLVGPRSAQCRDERELLARARE